MIRKPSRCLVVPGTLRATPWSNASKTVSGGEARDQADDRLAVAPGERIPARQVPRRERDVTRAPVRVRQNGRDPYGCRCGVSGIDVDAGLAEHFVKNGGIGRDDRQAAILGFQQGQSQAFVMRAADEEVSGVKQVIDPVGGLISVQRDARVFLESLPVVAPSR